MKRSETGLFARETTKSALESLRQRIGDQLTIVVGSGVSLGSRIPDWQTFTFRCLDGLTKDLSSRAYPADSATAVGDLATATELVIRSEGLIPTVELARSFVPQEQFVARIADALYSESLYAPQPNDAHHAIIDLARSWKASGSRVSIVTTNYDNLLSLAAQRTGDGFTTYIHDPSSDSGPLASQQATAEEEIRTFGKPISGAADSAGIPILHLHGLVAPSGGCQGSLVASEYDYFGDIGERIFASQRSLFKCARRGLLVFVGTSLADPRLVRLLLNSAGPLEDGRGLSESQSATVQDNTPTSIALFSEQILPWGNKRGSLSFEASQAWQHAYEKKWERAGVKVIWTDYFSQISQFLHEINPSSLGFPRSSDGGVSYGQRIDDWFDSFRRFPQPLESVSVYIDDDDERDQAGDDEPDLASEEHLRGATLSFGDWLNTGPDDDELFMVQQDVMRERLDEGVDAIWHLIVRSCASASTTSERFKLDLWIREPQTRSLVRLASSEYTFPDFFRCLRASIPQDDDYSVVRAFRSGVTVVDDGMGRWKTFICEPIRIREARTEASEFQSLGAPHYGTLPVGVVVLASSETLSDSLLAHAAVDFADVRLSLEEAGREMLTPSVSS